MRATDHPDYYKMRYYKRKLEGKCTRCGKPTKNAICEKCAEYQKKYERANPERIAYHHEYIEYKKRLGICTECKEDAVPGYKKCAKHLAINREKKKQQYRKTHGTK